MRPERGLRTVVLAAILTALMVAAAVYEAEHGTAYATAVFALCAVGALSTAVRAWPR